MKNRGQAAYCVHRKIAAIGSGRKKPMVCCLICQQTWQKGQTPPRVQIGYTEPRRRQPEVKPTRKELAAAGALIRKGDVVVYDNRDFVGAVRKKMSFGDYINYCLREQSKREILV